MIKKNVGRPTKVDYKIINKLENAFVSGANVSKACKYAGISRDTYYRYMGHDDIFIARVLAARKVRQNFDILVF